jgi:hypothetical protein
LLSGALAVALATALGGCDALTTGGRLDACWVGRHGNRPTATFETVALELARQGGLEAAAYPELFNDRPVFVVVYGNGAVIPELANERVINMTRREAVCVWFNDVDVRFYHGWSVGDPLVPGVPAP